MSMIEAAVKLFEELVKKSSFQKLKLIRKERTLDSTSFIFNGVEFIFHSDGDVECIGIYDNILEKYDYRSASEAIEKLQKWVFHIDANFDQLTLNPDKWPRPLVNRLLDWIKIKFSQITSK